MAASTTLPPVESTVVLYIRFTEEADNELLDLVKERLMEEGLKVLAVDSEDRIFGITTSQERLECKAQAIRLLKKRHDTHIMDAFDVEQKEKYCDTSVPYRDSYGLFSSNDRSLLVSQILEDTTVLAPNKTSSKLSQKVATLNMPFLEKVAPNIAVIQERIRLLTRDIVGDDQPRQNLLYVLQEADRVDAVAPFHSAGVKEQIWREVSGFIIMPPVDLIRDYYGEEIAFYFAWMGVLTKWLCFPGIVGFAASLHRWYRKDTIMNDEYTPFYGLVTFLWSILFLKWWERHESRLCYSWGVLVGEYEKRKYFAVRPEFYGILRTSPVSGQLEAFYPDYKRRLKYVGSAVVTMVMLNVAFWIMILSLNLQGYINPKNHPERWHEKNLHPFHWPGFSRLAEPGGIFDMNSSWRSLIPVALHVATISLLNALYRIVATRLTRWENHQTQLAFSNSLILKRFLFEAFDCYVALFYLAFYERNIDKLGSELVSVFNLDTVRRVAVECLVPMIVQRLTKKNRKEKGDINKKTDDVLTAKYTPLADQAALDEYEQFDE
jgi:anoctamin-10